MISVVEFPLFKFNPQKRIIQNWPLYQRWKGSDDLKPRLSTECQKHIFTNTVCTVFTSVVADPILFRNTTGL